jgi:hypothetical protein
MRRPRRGVLSTAITAGLALLIVAASPVAAVSLGPPVPLTSGAISNAWPGGFAGSGGSYLHAVYDVGEMYDSTVLYRRSSNGGASWTAPIELSRPGTDSFGPILAVNSATVDLIWHERDDPILEPGVWRLWYRRSTNSGASWTTPIPLDLGRGTPSIARQGTTVLVAATDDASGAVNFRRSADGGVTWESVRTWGKTENALWPSHEEGYPTMAFGTGVVYAVWNQGSRGIVLRRSFDAGLTWTWITPLNAPPIPASWARSTALPPRIAAAGSWALITYNIYDLDTGAESAAARRTADKGVHWAGQQKLSQGTRPAWPGAVARLGLKYRYVYHQCVEDGAVHAPPPGSDVGLPDRCKSGLYYRESGDGLSWSTAVRFSPLSHEEVGALGIAQTAVTGKYWIGWTRIASDAFSGDVFVRSFTP